MSAFKFSQCDYQTVNFSMNSLITALVKLKHFLKTARSATVVMGAHMPEM